MPLYLARFSQRAIFFQIEALYVTGGRWQTTRDSTVRLILNLIYVVCQGVNELLLQYNKHIICDVFYLFECWSHVDQSTKIDNNVMSFQT